MLKPIKKFLANQLAQKSRKLAGLHEGETCYIFGDGPSIKWFDLECFADHPAICCNLFPFHKDFDRLDVRYCTMIEPWIFSPNWLQPNLPSVTDFRVVSKAYKSIINSYPNKKFFVHFTNYFSIACKNVNVLFGGLPKSLSKTNKLLRKQDCFGGSFHAALTLAYYMGFKKIYLVGFDGWVLQPARAMHWYELGEGVFFEPMNYATEFLSTLQEDVEIIAIACDGISQNVQYISYESYSGKHPEYKENYELLSDRSLGILASYPGFKILPD